MLQGSSATVGLFLPRSQCVSDRVYAALSSEQLFILDSWSPGRAQPRPPSHVIEAGVSVAAAVAVCYTYFFDEGLLDRISSPHGSLRGCVGQVPDSQACLWSRLGMDLALSHCGQGRRHRLTRSTG